MMDGKMMKMGKKDMEMFNSGSMDSMDFESGDFGTLKMEGEVGESINFMGHGAIGKNGLEVKHLAVIGLSDMDDMDEEEDDRPEGAKKVMKKIMKGEGEDY